jgi:hypothetical protein
MKCKLCLSPCHEIFTAIVLKKYKARYFQCKSCGFVFIQEPSWLKEAYESPINQQDTGIIERNVYIAKKIASVIRLCFNVKGKFLDYGGGYGILVNLLRNKGLCFYWRDPLTQNLFARRYEYLSDLGQIELVTSIEAIEHFVNPVNDFEQMLTYSYSLFFTSHLLPKPTPKPDAWWYYGLDHGQHVSFYTQESLAVLAKKFNLNLVSNHTNIHMLTSKKIGSIQFNFALKVAALMSLIQ